MDDSPKREHNHPQSHDTDESVKDNSAPVTIQKVLVTERGAMILALVLIAIVASYALARAESARFLAERAQAQTEATRQQIMEHDALLIREGVLKPGDLTKGPSNYEHRSK